MISNNTEKENLIVKKLFFTLLLLLFECIKVLFESVGAAQHKPMWAEYLIENILHMC